MDLIPRAARTLARIFERATGQQISEERLWRIETLVNPLSRAHGFASLEQLVVRLDGDDQLVSEVIDVLLNNETSFFRDPSAFRLLGDEVLPQLAAQRRAQKRLRIWCAACSTGQEVWSLAMLFAENPARWNDWSIEILGTDISRAAIARARDGLYTQFEAQRGMPIRQLLAFFQPVLEEGWRIQQPTAARVSFARHNLMGPPPAGGPFDLILCRNALLYFSPTRRGEVLGRIAAAIAPDGALLLGAGETATGVSERFVADPSLLTIFRPAGAVALRPAVRAA